MKIKFLTIFLLSIFLVIFANQVNAQKNKLSLNILGGDPSATPEPCPTFSPSKQTSYGPGACVTPVPSVTPSPTPSPTPGAKLSPCNGFGDVNMDGIITEADATDTLRIVANLPSLQGAPYSNEQKRRANVDTRNNNVTSVDALMIKRYIAGLDNTFRACSQPTPTPTPSPTPSPTPTPTPTPAPSVRIIYPNGGESFTIGQTARIRWQSNNVDTCYLEYSFGPSSLNNIAIINNPNIGYYDWNVNIGNMWGISSRQVKIDLGCFKFGVTYVNDQSDNFFTVSQASSSAIKKSATPTPKSKARR